MKKLWPILGFAFVLRLIFIFGHYHPDLGNHLDWGNRFWEYGPKNFYTGSVWTVSWPNQPPGTIYLWAIMSKINQIVFGMAWWLNTHFKAFPSFVIPFLVKGLHPALVKLPSVLAELGIGVLIYRLLLFLGLKEKKALLGAIIFWFNPVTIYNSAVWGQTDGLVNFFALLSFYLLMEKKYFWAILAFVFSIYIKLSLIIFFPIFVLWLMREKVSLIKCLFFFFLSFLSVLLISLPFTHNNPVFWLKDLYVLRVLGGQGNMLTANAFNLWAIIFGIDLSRPDVGTFLGLGYKIWGYLLFGLSFLLTTGALIKSRLSRPSLFFGLSLVAFFSFTFLTNMHERYLYPVFPALAVLTAWGYFPLSFYLVLSFLHFFNLYNLWFYPQFNLLINFLKWPLTVKIFSLILLFFNFYLLYRSYLLKLKVGKNE